MTDIVERMRHEGTANPPLSYLSEMMLLEAADEIENLRAAQQRAPVAWVTPDELQRMRQFTYYDPDTPLYAAAPQQRQPLSDDDLETMWLRRDCSAAIQAGDIIGQVRAFARAVEAAHSIGITGEKT